MKGQAHMQQRHFEVIAAVLRGEKPGSACNASKYAQWRCIVTAFATKLQADNPKFKTATFEKACGFVSYGDWRLGL